MNESTVPGTLSAKSASPVAVHFEPTAVRCLAETRIWSAIEAKPNFRDRLLKESDGREKSSIQSNLSLLTDAYRVDPAISPRLDELREQLRKALRLVQPVDMYVVAHPEPNAFCVPSRKGTRLIMCLHSALFDLLTTPELLFVLGHEAAHALLGHTKIAQVGFDNPDFSALEVVRLRALSRSHEISCDRIGLLACQDVRSAASALFKIMSGLGAQWLTFDEVAFAKQFDEINDMSEFTDITNGAATHPIIALRVKALVAFSQSRLYSDWRGQPAAQLTTDDLEKSVEYMLSVVEPDLTSIESASEDEAANRVLTHGAFAIVASDGVVEPTEARFLKSKGIDVTTELRNELETADFVPKTLASIANDAQLLTKKLSIANRAGLLHQMCLVAANAGGIVTGELDVIVALANMLEVPPALLERILASATSSPLAPSEEKKRRTPRKKKTEKPESAEAPPAPPSDSNP
jgi:hypothetical protein